MRSFQRSSARRMGVGGCRVRTKAILSSSSFRKCCRNSPTNAKLGTASRLRVPRLSKKLLGVAAVRRTPLLPTPDKDLLEEALIAPLRKDEHDRLAAALPCLHLIEYRDPPSPRVLGPEVKIAAWNAERCKYLSPTAALLADIDADVVLLSEMDIGMARSGNRHTISELAGMLGSGYAFGVEYVELGLGDDREKSWHAGQSNAGSLHGNGILTHAPLDHLDM